ncbi:MAG TPA: hypothetical protein VHB21_03180, partial [Minicystis sp.]|nr:hypothetical protein [Minicystis sp.]
MKSPPHLIGIERGWGLWRDFLLRGAGFPLDWPLRLAAPAFSAAVDRWIAADDEVGATRRTAADALEA